MIITNANAIPDRFKSNYSPLSDTGKEKLKKLFNAKNEIHLKSVEEMLNIVFNVSLAPIGKIRKRIQAQCRISP